MKKQYFLRCLFLWGLTLGTAHMVLAQCVIANPLGTPVTTTSGKSSSQSFQVPALCPAGTFSSITVYSTTNNTQVTLNIYEGEGPGGVLLYTQSGIVFSAISPDANIITLGSGTGLLNYVPGNQYTFQLSVPSGNINLVKNSSNVNTYPPGTLYNNGGQAQNNQDLFFAVQTTGQMPVSWLNVNAVQRAGGGIYLHWSTADELDNRGFTIEHSTDARVWNALGWQDGQGNASETTEYRFLHTEAQSGNNYYRLRQQDWDGTESLSPVVHVTYSAEAVPPPLTFYPNPVGSDRQLTLSGGVEETLTLQLFNSQGQLCWSTRIAVGDNRTLRLPQHLVRGIYHYRLTGATHTDGGTCLLQ